MSSNTSNPAVNAAANAEAEQIVKQNMPAFKVETATLADILRDASGNIDTSANVRESEKYDRDDVDMIRLMGQIDEHRKAFGGSGLREPIKAMRVDGPDGKKRLQILQGYRRAHALQHLGLTETPFKVLVYPPLTQRQFITLLIDQGDRLDLNKVEAYTAVKRALSYGKTQSEIANDYLPLLQKISPFTEERRKKCLAADGKTLDPAKVRDTYRGTIQGFQRVAESPTVVEDAYVLKLKDKQRWPTDGEIRELYDAHKTDQRDDPTVTRENPGPLFTEKWNKILAAVEAAAQSGDARPKSTGMKNRKAVDKSITETRSVLWKALMMNLTNDPRVNDVKIKQFEDIQAELEKRLTADEWTKIRELFGLKPKPVDPMQGGPANPPPAESTVTVTTEEPKALTDQSEAEAEAEAEAGEAEDVQDAEVVDEAK